MTHPGACTRAAAFLAAGWGLAVAGQAAAGEQGVVGYRHDGTGVFPAATPATDWDITTGRNVLWKVRFPDWGHGPPILVGDKVLVNTEPQWLYCIDADTGRTLWKCESNVFDLLPTGSAPRLKEAWRVNWRLRGELEQITAKLKALVVWSPIAIAGSHLFVPSQKGGVAVFDISGAQPRLIGVRPTESAQGAPIFAGGRMYLRTKWTLLCIGRRQTKP